MGLVGIVLGLGYGTKAVTFFCMHSCMPLAVCVCLDLPVYRVGVSHTEAVYPGLWPKQLGPICSWCCPCGLWQPEPGALACCI